MNLSERINAFVTLGERLQTLSESEKILMFKSAKDENGWFIEESITLALRGIVKFLKKESLIDWTNSYDLKDGKPKTIGVAMAGNIPLVGFHDLLCVLIAGHKLHAKLSHQDTYLMNLISKWIIEIEPRFTSLISLTDRLNHVDAVIATGSDNTARYFDYYFRNIPHIIRKNRSSCAILLGEESEDELRKLGFDVFSYFGMGCRNVSKIYVPYQYDLAPISIAFEQYSSVANHNKYMNNYDYQKALLVLNNTPFYDNGFSILKEDQGLVSPLATIFYEPYVAQQDLAEKINLCVGKIQCISSASGWYKNSVAFGETQFPNLNDYADNLDTLRFLATL
jgi:hypothetical protein